MVLSDATIARLLAEGRIEIDPYEESLLQPSSVDVRVDRLFRVFHNNRYPFIDVKVEQEELTELVEVDDPWGHGMSLEWATSCPPPLRNFDRMPRIRSERPAFDLHHPEIVGRPRLPEPEPVAVSADDGGDVR